MPAAEYHVPGEEITGQNVKHGERVLTIDSMLIQHVFLSDIDEAMAHFEVRSKYSQMMGTGLSDTFDNHIGRNLVACGSASAVASMGAAGQGVIIDDAELGSATDATQVAAMVDFLFQAAQTLDEKKVPAEGRYCVMKPAEYYKLVKTVQTSGFSAIHRDYGGAGSFATGQVFMIAGISIISTNRVPTADYSAEAFHAVDCRNVKAIVFTADAVGTVKLLDLSLQSEWDIRRQGTLMVARYAMGHGILQPECVVIGRTAAGV